MNKTFTTEHYPAHKPSKLVCMIVTWFGSGLSPVMPGTIGSLAALPFAALLIFPWGPEIGRWILLGAAVSVFCLGWLCSNIYLHTTGRQDPGEIVIDEVAGQWIVLCVAPPTVSGWVLSFILFRAADIVKPFPVSYVDNHVKGGLGVMLDDIIASLYAASFIAVGSYYNLIPNL